MQTNRVNPRHISYLCIALCILFAGGYILRQNYLLDRIYKNATPYDYIPAGEIRTILVTSPAFLCDSTSALPYWQRTHTLVMLWQEICATAKLPVTDTLVVSFSQDGETALWYRSSKAEQKQLARQLPRLLSNHYRPVSERVGLTSVHHYALPNGRFLHTLSAPGVTAFSFESSLFHEALQTVDVLSHREQFTEVLDSLDPRRPARLLHQINDRGYRSSGRWEGTIVQHSAPKANPTDSSNTRP